MQEQEKIRVQSDRINGVPSAGCSQEILRVEPGDVGRFDCRFERGTEAIALCAEMFPVWPGEPMIGKSDGDVGRQDGRSVQPSVVDVMAIQRLRHHKFRGRCEMRQRSTTRVLKTSQ